MCSSYSRAYHDEYDFDSAESARNSNCHGVYKNKDEYKINKYKVTYTLIEEDCKAKNEEVTKPDPLEELIKKLLKENSKE